MIMGTINRTTSDLNNRTRSALILSAPEAVIGDNTYRSPGTNVVQVDPKFTENINYTGGSAVYVGLETIQIRISSTVSVSSVVANTTLFFTSGINGTPDTSQEITSILTKGGDVKELSHQAVFEISTGDTLDFYLKGNNNMTIEKAVWLISRHCG